jgi:phage gpG-like protein
MAKISLKPTNLPSVQRAMGQFGDELQDELGMSLRDGLEWAKARARKLVRVQSGRLRRSIYTRVLKTRNGWSGTLGSDAPHANIREFGGTIRAKNKAFLMFRTRSGQFVQVKQVTQKATPYMRPAIRQSRADIVRELNGGMRRAAGTIAKAAR